ncbi:MAG: hypothetical protein ACJAZJ_000570 [Candidatus Endobugula sp.]|jgi:hypothetical protein
MIISSMSYATDINLNKQDLFGEWQVIQIDDRVSTADKEVWEFQKNQIYILIDEITDSSTTYEVLNDTIYIDSERVKILQFNDNTMTLDGLGAIYHLKKLNM